MPLILKEEEKRLVLEALEILAKYNPRAEDFLYLLNQNPDCTVWVIMTEKGYKEWGESYGKGGSKR